MTTGNGPETFSAVGINGKNSEFHAAMGLLNLNYIDEIILKRSHQYKLYQTLLKSKSITFQKIANNVKYNFAYMPIVLDSENQAYVVIAVVDSLISLVIKFQPNSE